MTHRGPFRVTGWEYTTLVLAALAVLGAHAVGALLAYRRPIYDHSTGCLFVIAHDLLNGTLYRPLLSDLGLGGTRYFPAYPVLIAGLVRPGMDFLRAGLLINVVSWGLALGGSLSVLRGLAVDRRLAAVFAVFSVGSFGTLMTLTSVRGDLLPVAISLWGVVAVQRALAGGRDGYLIVAAMLFCLAAAAKVTALFWPLAVAGYLAMSGRWARVVRFSAMMVLGVALLAVAVQTASGGRFLAMMAATAGGGGGFLRFLQGPIYFENMIRGEDPLAFLAVAASIVLLVTRFAELRASLASWLFVSLAVMTICILGSRGTMQNHLIDVNAAAMILVATRYRDLRLRPNIVPLFILVYALFVGGRFDYRYVTDWDYGFRTEAENHARSIPGEILSEDPGIVLAAGRNPYLADAFMLNVLRSKRPEVPARLNEAIESRAFDAVLLTHVGEIGWYENVHFGGIFKDIVDRYYVRDKKFGRYEFYIPRPDPPPPGGRRGDGS